MPLKFIDLFAGLGGFHRALASLGFECVFASEINTILRDLYKLNFPEVADVTYGDIREFKHLVPAHDILCAGFPCQPFSKSGAQQGVLDRTRGTLFREIIDILEVHEPQYVILENVGNFERHDKGQTWKVVHDSLKKLGYDVKGTEHIEEGGTGLLSPHHFGFPHSRERFFIVAKKGKLPTNPLPTPNRAAITALSDIVQQERELSEKDKLETALSAQQFSCIELWNEFLRLIPANDVPSFPLWSDELDATYPYEKSTPFASSAQVLRYHLNGKAPKANATREELINLYPSYARSKKKKFPKWKIRFIKQNREWFKAHRDIIPDSWITRLRTYPSSLRKLEWNIKEADNHSLWNYVLQFRPSGLRVRKYTSSPALVAMTKTQIPILGPERRFLTRKEGLLLQGFPTTHLLPKTYTAAFRALGNAVHVGVVKEIAKTLIDALEVRDRVPEVDTCVAVNSMEVENTPTFFRELCEISTN